jgi:hypothetical protein
MMGADAMKFTSRIFEGLTLLRGLVEPREGRLLWLLRRGRQKEPQWGAPLGLLVAAIADLEPA